VRPTWSPPCGRGAPAEPAGPVAVGNQDTGGSSHGALRSPGRRDRGAGRLPAMGLSGGPSPSRGSCRTAGRRSIPSSSWPSPGREHGEGLAGKGRLIYVHCHVVVSVRTGRAVLLPGATLRCWLVTSMVGPAGPVTSRQQLVILAGLRLAPVTEADDLGLGAGPGRPDGPVAPAGPCSFQGIAVVPFGHEVPASWSTNTCQPLSSAFVQHPWITPVLSTGLGLDCRAPWQARRNGA
jgi:hypothetical protein